MQFATPHPHPHPHPHPQAHSHPPPPHPHQAMFPHPQTPQHPQYPVQSHPIYQPPAAANPSSYPQHMGMNVAAGMTEAQMQTQRLQGPGPGGVGVHMQMPGYAGGVGGLDQGQGAVASGSGGGGQYPGINTPHPQQQYQYAQPQTPQHPSHPHCHPHPQNTHPIISVAPGSGIIAQRHPRIPMQPPPRPQPPGGYQQLQQQQHHGQVQGQMQGPGRGRGMGMQSQGGGAVGGMGSGNIQGTPSGVRRAGDLELDLDGVQWIPQAEMEVITPGGGVLRQATQTPAMSIAATPGRSRAPSQTQQILSIAQGRNQALSQAQMEAVLQQELRSGRIQAQTTAGRQASMSSVSAVQGQQGQGQGQRMVQQNTGGSARGNEGRGQGQVGAEGYTLMNEAGELLAQIPPTGLVLPFDHGVSQYQQQQLTNEAGQPVALPAWMRGDARGAYQYLAADGRTILPMSGAGSAVMPSPSMGGTGIEELQMQEQEQEQERGEAVMVQQADGSVMRMWAPARAEEQRAHALQAGNANDPAQQTPKIPTLPAQSGVQPVAGSSQASFSTQQDGKPYPPFRRPDYQSQNEYGSVSSQPAQSQNSRILSEGPEVASPVNMMETKRAAQAALGLGAPAGAGVSFPDLHASLQAMEGEGMRSGGDMASFVGRDVNSLSYEEQKMLMDHGFRAREVVRNAGQVVRVVELPESGGVGNAVQAGVPAEEMVDVDPAMTYGQANMRMAHFFEGLRRICETRSHALAVDVTQEYFVSDAVFTVIRKGANGADVTSNNLPQCILPRWFLVMHDINVRRTTWTVADPVETYLRSVDEPALAANDTTTPEGVLLETEGLSWAKYYDNGSVIISHGVGRSIWRIDPATKMLKMYRLEIAFDYHDDLIERSAADKLVESQYLGSQLFGQASEAGMTSPIARGPSSMSLPTPPSSISGHPHSFHLAAGSRTKLEQQFPQLRKGTSNIDPQEYAGDAGQVGFEHMGQMQGRAGLPESPQAQAPFGIPQQATRFLELAETFTQMMPLIHMYQREKMNRARTALRLHVASGRAGIKNPSIPIEGMPLDLHSRVMLTPTQVPSVQPPFPVPDFARPSGTSQPTPSASVSMQTPQAMTRGLSVQTNDLPSLTPAGPSSSLPNQYTATPVSVMAQTPATVTGATPHLPQSSIEIASNISLPVALPAEMDKLATPVQAALPEPGNGRKRKATVTTSIEGGETEDLLEAEKRALANAPALPNRKGTGRKKAKKA